MSLLLSGAVVAQQPPTATGNQGYTSPDFWSRSGNGNFGANGANNIFGTRWNSPIYFITGGLTPTTYRMKLNGEMGGNQYPINGYTNFGNAAGQVNTSGFLGLGNNVNGGPGSTPLWSGGNSGPFTLLH